MFRGISGCFLELILTFSANITYTSLCKHQESPYTIFTFIVSSLSGGGMHMKFPKHDFPHILTWICELRHGDKTMWAIFHEESKFLGPRT